MCVNRWTSPLSSIQERAQPEYSECNKPHTCGINMCACLACRKGPSRNTVSATKVSKVGENIAKEYSEPNKGLKE